MGEHRNEPYRRADDRGNTGSISVSGRASTSRGLYFTWLVGGAAEPRHNNVTLVTLTFRRHAGV